MDLKLLPLRARAPAKVNLCLHVGRRRSDGLHEICSLFQSVTLADEVILTLADGGADEVVCPDVEGPNLAEIALEAFRAGFSWSGPPVRVTIEKRIPIAAGLGGGSADAAAVLRLLSKVSGVSPPLEELEALAFGIGSDVPSQILPGTHLVTGAGNVVERLPPLRGLALGIVTSEEQLATPDVYARSDELGREERRLAWVAKALRAAVHNAERATDLVSLMENDLEPAAVDLVPSTRSAVVALRAEGALASIVTGSGPTAVGLFADLDRAVRACKAIAPQVEGDAIAVVAAGAPYGAPFGDVTAARSGNGQ
jgi:4-diphosphocytidyl-2-C-methyl-D-erythritol kinase